MISSLCIYLGKACTRSVNHLIVGKRLEARTYSNQSNTGQWRRSRAETKVIYPYAALYASTVVMNKERLLQKLFSTVHKLLHNRRTSGIGIRLIIIHKLLCTTQPISIFRGSSINSFILTRNVTASLPSSRRWSYVKARYIICNVSKSKPEATIIWSAYRTNLDLSVYYYGLLLNGVKTKHSSLREIDDWRTHE